MSTRLGVRDFVSPRGPLVAADYDCLLILDAVKAIGSALAQRQVMGSGPTLSRQSRLCRRMSLLCLSRLRVCDG